MSDAEDRLERLRKLESLRRIAADVARGDSQGLAEVKEEGRLIVEKREAEIAGRPLLPGEYRSPGPWSAEPEPGVSTVVEISEATGADAEMVLRAEVGALEREIEAELEQRGIEHE